MVENGTSKNQWGCGGVDMEFGGALWGDLYITNMKDEASDQHNPNTASEMNKEVHDASNSPTGNFENH